MARASRCAFSSRPASSMKRRCLRLSCRPGRSSAAAGDGRECDPGAWWEIRVIPVGQIVATWPDAVFGPRLRINAAKSAMGDSMRKPIGNEIALSGALIGSSSTDVSQRATKSAELTMWPCSPWWPSCFGYELCKHALELISSIAAWGNGLRPDSVHACVGIYEMSSNNSTPACGRMKGIHSRPICRRIPATCIVRA
jgi:hypothetical protein